VENIVMNQNIVVNDRVIELEFQDSTSFKNSKEKTESRFKKSSFDKTYIYAIDDEKLKIGFYTKNNQSFLYENCEELLYYLFSSLNIIDNNILKIGLDKGLKTLKSNKFLFMLPSQRKFLIEPREKSIILIPISNISFRDEDKLQEYYRDFCMVVMKSLESFMRNRISIKDRRIFIEYYDAIDQFLYIIKELVSSPKLFEQNLPVKDFMVDITRFLVKHTVNKELKNLNVEANYDQQLSKFRYLTLITYKLFSKLSHSGAIENLDHNDIMQLADAITYDKAFEKVPSVISKAYNNLHKVLPFRTVERILKRQKNLEYYF
jgi:hypothetical protein